MDRLFNKYARGFNDAKFRRKLSSRDDSLRRFNYEQVDSPSKLSRRVRIFNYEEFYKLILLEKSAVICYCSWPFIQIIKRPAFKKHILEVINSGGNQIYFKLVKHKKTGVWTEIYIPDDITELPMIMPDEIQMYLEMSKGGGLYVHLYE